MSGGIREYARHRAQMGLAGQTDGAVRKAIRTGRIPGPKDGRLDFAACDAAWGGTPAAALKAEAHREQTRQPERCKHEQPEPDENQAQRLLRLKADYEELRLAERRRELVPAADVTRQTIENERKKAAAFSNLPKQLAPALVMKTLDEVEAILEDAIEKFRQQISDEFAKQPAQTGDHGDGSDSGQ